MSQLSRHPAPGRAEQQLLAAPRQDAVVAAVLVVITIGVLAAVANHGTFVRIQRLDEAWRG